MDITQTIIIETQIIVGISYSHLINCSIPDDYINLITRKSK